MKGDELTKEIYFTEEVNRVFKKIDKILALKLKGKGSLITDKQLECLFFDKDERIEIDDCLSKEREIFIDWIKEEYNIQIEVFLDSTIKEKRISTLFFIEALNKFKTQAIQFIK